jgi:hypothetical protein
MVFDAASNVLRLHSFHEQQDVRSTAESKGRLAALGSVLRVSCHQSTSTASCCGARLCRPTGCRSRNRCQVSLANTHETSRWSVVSSSCAQRAQAASCWSPCRLHLSAVQRQPCKYRWPSGRPGLARHGLCQAWPDGGQASTARRVSWVVPNWASCLTNDPGTACRAVFRAGSPREARPIQRAVPA